MLDRSRAEENLHTRTICDAAVVLAEDAAGLSTLFRERGYLDPVPVLDREECDRLLAAVLAETRGPLDWHKGWAASSPVYYRIATDERIVALVTELLGPDVLLWGASLLTRPPGVAHPWHTDIESSDPRSETVAVWLALAETNAASSLKVVPYSHRFGRELQRVMQEHRATRETVTDDDVAAWARELDDRSGMVTAATADGQALVFDGRLWHGSQNLNESGTRQALLLQYTTT